jgi:hypothetical protein
VTRAEVLKEVELGKGVSEAKLWAKQALDALTKVRKVPANVARIGASLGRRHLIYFLLFLGVSLLVVSRFWSWNSGEDVTVTPPEASPAVIEPPPPPPPKLTARTWFVKEWGVQSYDNMQTGTIECRHTMEYAIEITNTGSVTVRLNDREEWWDPYEYGQPFYFRWTKSWWDLEPGRTVTYTQFLYPHIIPNGLGLDRDRCPQGTLGPATGRSIFRGTDPSGNLVETEEILIQR